MTHKQYKIFVIFHIFHNFMAGGDSWTRYSSSEYILFRILAQPTSEDDAYREVLQAIML